MAGHPMTSKELVQVVDPDTTVKREAGWCLSHTQAVFKAPVMFPSATAAANATTQRIASRTMPNVAVPVWFDHYGTYQGRYDNWGHVVAWIPRRGFLSSPTSGYGQQWFPSIEAVERAFNAKFRFYTLDINTLRVAEAAPIQEEDPMPKSTRITYRPEKGREIGKAWKYLTINGKGDVTVLGGGSKGRHAIVFCNLDVSGEVDVRAVVEKTSPDGKKVERSNVNYYVRMNRLGTYSIPLDIPKDYRLRFQARAVGDKPVVVGQMGYSVDYWEK